MRETFDKQKALSMLRQRGIMKVVLEFSGGNDEGGVESSVYLDIDGNEVELADDLYQQNMWDPVANTWKAGPWEKYVKGGTSRPATPAEIEDAELRAACEASVYERYGSFAGEFQVSGTVTFDLMHPGGTVVMEASEGTTQWNEVRGDL